MSMMGSSAARRPCLQRESDERDAGGGDKGAPGNGLSVARSWCCRLHTHSSLHSLTIEAGICKLATATATTLTAATLDTDFTEEHGRTRTRQNQLIRAACHRQSPAPPEPDDACDGTTQIEVRGLSDPEWSTGTRVGPEAEE